MPMSSSSLFAFQTSPLFARTHMRAHTGIIRQGIGRVQNIPTDCGAYRSSHSKIQEGRICWCCSDIAICYNRNDIEDQDNIYFMRWRMSSTLRAICLYDDVAVPRGGENVCIPQHTPAMIERWVKLLEKQRGTVRFRSNRVDSSWEMRAFCGT